MSPSHDSYLSGKFGRNKFIPSVYRLKMVEMATDHSNWISHDAWECKQNYFVDFPYVASRSIKRFRDFYCEKYKLIEEHSQLQIYYVCGLDHADKCSLLKGRLQRIG
eukprot:129737_1